MVFFMLSLPTTARLHATLESKSRARQKKKREKKSCDRLVSEMWKSFEKRVMEGN